MAPKRNAATAPSVSASASREPITITPKASKITKTGGTQPSHYAATASSSANAQDFPRILQGVYNNYLSHTPQRVKLLDAFMAFLVIVGVLQFAYCVLAGNYPFNAFLAGFSATVGQFVLTASLRLQTNPENKVDFESISHERAFADFVFGSMILHFFCVNFIN